MADRHVPVSGIMRKYLVNISILILLISGCAPMPYEDLSGDSSSISIDRNEYDIAAEEKGESIEVRFQSVPGARSYGYGLSSNDVVRFSKSELAFSSGYYTANISRDIFSSSDDGASSRASGGKFSIVLFASTRNEPVDSDWIILNAVDVSLSLGIAPNLTIAERGETSITLDARSEAISGNMSYSVSYGDGRIATFDSVNLPYTIEGIGTEPFEITVMHKYIGSGAYCDQKQTLSVPEYDPRQADIDIKIQDDGSIALSGIPAEADALSNLGVVSVGSDNTLSLLHSQMNNVSGTATLDGSVFGSGFYVGSVRVVFYNNDPNDEDAIISSAIDYEAELSAVKTDEKLGRQSYSVSIPVSDKLGLTDADITVSGIPGAAIEKSFADGVLDISIGAGELFSRTAYSLDISFNIPSYGKVTKSLDFTTASFGGSYEWKYDDSNQFAVIVEPAPDGSKFNYYVYTSPLDNKYSGEKLCLSPLFENDADASNLSYGDEKLKAYRWNNEKWNTSSMKPDSLSKITTTIKNKDSVSADVVSKALGISVTTKTELFFKEKADGTCYMVFHNEITNGPGGNYLRENPSPNPDNFEESPYYYSLVRLGDN